MAINLPKNYYTDQPPKFAELALQFPEFGKYVRGNSDHLTGGCKFKSVIDFRNPNAVRELSRCLLKKDFKVDIEMPLNRLIPTIPSRFNYIWWIKELISEHNHCNGETPSCSTTSGISGVDIGCGPTVIYAILGCQNFGWHFIASEIDKISFDMAQQNINNNNLTEKISVNLVSGDTILKDALKGKDKQITFTMCNPPFFEDFATVLSTQDNENGRPRPSSISTASLSESVTYGGEVCFVKKMIDESIDLGTKVRWYTTLLGCKKSLHQILSYLKQKEVTSVLSSPLIQGRSHRWVVAWTFALDGIKISSNYRINSEVTGWMFELQITHHSSLGEIQNSESLREAINLTTGALESFKINFTVLPELQNGIIPIECIAIENTWKNRRRKRRAGMMEPLPPNKEDTNPNDVSNPLLEFTVHLCITKNSVSMAAKCVIGTQSSFHEFLIHLKNCLKCQSVKKHICLNKPDHCWCGFEIQ